MDISLPQQTQTIIDENEGKGTARLQYSRIWDIE
jgi:hypothetical protein